MAGARGLLARRDGLFVYVEDPDADPLTLLDITTGEVVGTAGSREVTQLRPNRGVQGVIAATLVQFQLSSDDPAAASPRSTPSRTIPRRATSPILEELIANETDGRARAGRGCSCPRSSSPFPTRTPPAWRRSAALRAMSASTARATLNPLLVTRTEFAEALPEDANIARELEPGRMR
jgi:urea transport system permease protein